MRHFYLHLLAIAAGALALGGVALAQERPEFTLGFADLAGQIPEVAGTPLEAEHHGPTGDSLQRTSTGLMVWRKADNWTAFTDGSRTWVNGPLGLQERRNEETFDWESEAVPPVAAPTAPPMPAATPAATASPAPTPMPSPTLAPRPTLRSSPPHMIQGQGLDANSVWVMGEVCNEGSTPAYNVVVTARLLDATGSVAGTANQAFAYLGPGDTVGYGIAVRGAPPNTRAEVSVDSSSSGFAAFARLPIAWVKNEKIVGGRSDIRYEFTGTLSNSGSRPVSLTAILVWFLDDQSRVVWMEQTYAPNALAPGDSHTFVVRTTRDEENPQISGISQVRYYAAGRLP